MNKKHKKKKKRGKPEKNKENEQRPEAEVPEPDAGPEDEKPEVVKPEVVDRPDLSLVPDPDLEFPRTDAERCYDVKYSDVMGRYLVANRVLEPGQLILQEPALAAGPCSGCPVVCLACCRELGDTVPCPSCRWPLCSATCAGVGERTGHAPAECRALTAVKPDYDDLEELRESYHAIMPLRVLLLRDTDPERWASVCSMESHDAVRRGRADIWPVNQRLVVDRLRGWGLGFDDELVHRVCGVLEVNAFEIGAHPYTARALYARASLLAHACTPRAAHTDLRARARPLALRAAVRMQPGDEITLSYAYTLQGTAQRRAHLLRCKMFLCSCPRCAAPDELGALCSALLCTACAGHVLPAPAGERVPEGPTVWSCAQCGRRAPGDVDRLIDRLTEEYEAIDANDVRGYEHFLHKYRNVLHARHHLALAAKHSLSQLYGKVRGYMIQQLSRAQLQRKADICRELMQVFDIIEPGFTRLRGVTLYELHAPLMVLATRDYEDKAIGRRELRTRLKEIVSLLSEAARVLGAECPRSAEGAMAAAARDALQRMTSWETLLGKIT